MTGYGRGEVQINNETVLVEVRSVNNRFLDIALRIQKKFSVFEDKIKDIIQQEAIRGRIDVFISTSEEPDKILNIKLNSDLAQSYANALEKLQKELKLTGGISLTDLLRFDDILTYEYSTEDVEYLWPRIEEALVIALGELNEMRRDEGKNLENDLKKRAWNMQDTLKSIKEIAESRVPEEYQKLKDKLKELVREEHKIDEGRLEIEIAILAEKIDITEECTRLDSHIFLFLESLEKGGVVGRKIEFILQEMNREVSTIGAKSNSADIAHKVVELKEEIEKIREQARNIL